MTETITTAPHAACQTCKVDLATPERAQAHLRETQEAHPRGWSHRVLRLNPTAQQRISLLVEDAMCGALDGFCEDMDRAVQRGDVTDEQVSDELGRCREFSDYWDSWLTENRSD